MLWRKRGRYDARAGFDTRFFFFFAISACTRGVESASWYKLSPTSVVGVTTADTLWNITASMYKPHAAGHPPLDQTPTYVARKSHTVVAIRIASRGVFFFRRGDRGVAITGGRRRYHVHNPRLVVRSIAENHALLRKSTTKFVCQQTFEKVIGRAPVGASTAQ